MNWGYKPALSARAPILPSLLFNFFDSSWSDQTNSSRRTSTQVTRYHPSIRGWSLTISNLRRREFRRTLPPALIFNNPATLGCLHFLMGLRSLQKVTVCKIKIVTLPACGQLTRAGNKRGLGWYVI